MSESARRRLRADRCDDALRRDGAAVFARRTGWPTMMALNLPQGSSVRRTTEQADKRWVICGAALLLSLGMACASSAATKNGKKSPYLTLFAFNYSDRYVADIVVDGRWMGGADPFTNSGSAMGPKAPRGTGTLELDVSWGDGGEYDLQTRSYREGTMRSGRSQASVTVQKPYPSDPSELVLHFYQDGHVEAELLGRGGDRWALRRVPIPAGHPRHGQR